VQLFRAVHQRQRHVVERAHVGGGDIGGAETPRVDADARHGQDLLLFVVGGVDLAFDQARAADQGHGFVLAHELPCGGLGGGGVALIVQGLVFDLAAVDAAVCIDLLEVGGGCLRGLREGGRAALGVHR